MAGATGPAPTPRPHERAAAATPRRRAWRLCIAGGNHATVYVGRDETDAALDVTEVLAQPGGGPPPHSHALGEWFVVLEGELTLCEERDGTVVSTEVLRLGDSVWVPPWTVHGTLNFSAASARFEVVGQPGAVSAYFDGAGVRVADETTPPSREPPGPSEAQEIVSRWEIEFWTRPVDVTPSQ